MLPMRRRGAENLSLGRDLALTSAACALVCVAASGFARVFLGASWVVPVMASAAAASAAAFAGRRAGLPSPVRALCGLLAIWVTSTELVVLRSSTQTGLPLMRTLSAAIGASGPAAAELSSAVAPLRPVPGLVLWAAWAAGTAAMAANSLAARRPSLEANVPPLLVFLATCVTGDPAGRGWALISFIAASVLFALAHQWLFKGPAAGASSEPGGVPKPAHARWRRPGPLVTSGVTLLGAAVLAGATCLPALGKESPALARWRQDFQNNPRVVPDPLVSLRAELLDEPRTPMFVVHSTAAAYWRLTSLQDFDGTNWTGSGAYLPVHKRLPGVPHLGARQVEETFDIQELNSAWLPVAFQPESVSLGAGTSYDAASNSLLTPEQTTSGEAYKVDAVEDLAALSPATLAHTKAVPSNERSPLGQFLQVPRGIPPALVRLANVLTGRFAGEYQKAMALQDFFHRAPFVYTLSPPNQGSGTNALTSFLFQTHAGYCQQYAAAYALLARLAGLPARVAVGFSTGEEIGPGTWQVLGQDAHAWPEVWFPSAGWVPFEPTPTFAIPGAAQYQAGQSQAPQASQAAGPTSGLAKPAPGSLSGVRDRAGSGRGARPSGGSRSGSAVPVMALVAAAPVALVIAWACLVWVLEALRRHRRLRGTRDAAARLLFAWEELSEELGLSGLGRRASETPAEWAHRAGKALKGRGTVTPEQQSCLAEVADALCHVLYGRSAPGTDELSRLQEMLIDIGRRVHRARSWHERLLQHMDPRTAWHRLTVSPS